MNHCASDGCTSGVSRGDDGPAEDGECSERVGERVCGECEVGDVQSENESLDDVVSERTSKSACGSSDSSAAFSSMFDAAIGWWQWKRADGRMEVGK